MNMRAGGTHSSQFFTKGIWQELTKMVRSYLQPKVEVQRPVTAVFINWRRLTVTQLIEMQKTWKCPVFDRLANIPLKFMFKLPLD